MPRSEDENNLIVKAIQERFSSIFVKEKIVGRKNQAWLEIMKKLEDQSVNISTGGLYTFVYKNYHGVRDKCGIPCSSTARAQETAPTLEAESEALPEISDEWEGENSLVEGILSFVVNVTCREFDDHFNPTERQRKRMQKGRSTTTNEIVVDSKYTDFVKRNISSFVSCCIGIKYCHISETNQPYLRIRGRCKECGASLEGWLDTRPENGETSQLKFNVTNYDPSFVHHKKRLTGDIKSYALDKILSQKYSCEQTRRELASEGQEAPRGVTLRVAAHRERAKDYRHGDPFEALTIMRREGKFANTIHNVGYCPFFVYIWSPEQLQEFKAYVKTTPGSRISIDATGNVVKPLKRPFGEVSKRIFLYEVAVNDSTQKRQYPVAHMLSECHTTLAISNWLETFVASGAPSPYEICTDTSLALLSAASRAFLGMNSIWQYIHECGEILFHGSPHRLTCYIRCDVAHTVKLFRRFACLQGKNVVESIRREFYIRSLVLILKSESWKEAENFIVCIATVALTKFNTTDDVVFQERLSELQRKVSFREIKDAAEKELRKDAEDEEDGVAEEGKRHEELMLPQAYAGKKNNIFVTKIEEIIQGVRNNIGGQAGEIQNQLYCPGFTDKLEHHAEFLPLWSNIMKQFFPKSQELPSSTASESNFKDVKKIVFAHKVLPVRLDEFLETYITSMDGLLKLAATEKVQPTVKHEGKRQKTYNSVDKISIWKESVQDKLKGEMWSSILEEVEFLDDDVKKEVLRSLDCRVLPAYFFSDVDDMNLFLKDIRTKEKLSVSAIHLSQKADDDKYTSDMRYSLMKGPDSLKKFIIDELTRSQEQDNAFPPLQSSQEEWQGASEAQDNGVFHRIKRSSNYEDIQDEHSYFAISHNNNNNDVCDLSQPLNMIQVDQRQALGLQENWKGQNKAVPIKRKGYYIEKRREMSNVNFRDIKNVNKIPILKNGNDLSTMFFNGNLCMFRNTCSFDAILQIVAVAYSDSEAYQQKIQRILHDNAFFQMVKSVVTTGVNMQTYRQRGKILLEICDSFDIPNIKVVECFSTLEQVAETIFNSLPSFTLQYYCENCLETYQEKLVLAKIHIDNWDSFEEKLHNYGHPEVTTCCQCRSLCYYVSTNTSGYHIFLCPTFNFQGRVSEKGVPLDTIPLRLTLGDKEYILTGVIGFQPPRSNHDVGHFTAYAIRGQHYWELYDDTDNKTRTCRGTTIVQIHGLFYICT